jgi:hypothetical protein
MEAALSLDKVQTLKAVEIEAKRDEPDSRRMLYGVPGKTLVVDPQICAGAVNILQLIQGRFAGVQVSGSGFNMSVLIRNQPATFMLDGMVLNDATMISSISPCDVEAIDLITGPSLVSRGGGGVISILTRRGGPNYNPSDEKAAGVSVSTIMGFEVIKEFYSPSYEAPAQTNIADYRSTVYWNPSVTTDKDGKAQVIFWNTDERTTMRVSLEGMSWRGRLAAGIGEYLVK